VTPKIAKSVKRIAIGLAYTLGVEASMILWKRAALLGFLSWLVPFAVSFIVFPLKKSNPPLFITLMSLAVLVAGGALLTRYFRNRPVSVREAVLVGALWFFMNLVFDYPMFAYGPMKMTAPRYYSEIGMSYLTFPALAFWAARLVKS
jgi:uncharacterized membrane protein YpjA